MAVRVARKVFDFLAENYKEKDHQVKILSDGFDHSSVSAQPKNKKNFIERWYLSLQGEEAPIISTSQISEEDKSEERIYRYDWAFGVTVIKDFWWNWRDELCQDGALAVHLLLQPKGNPPEALPISATLSALRPSRNTKGFWEIAGPVLPRVAAEAAKIGSQVIQPLQYVSAGLSGASNILDSYNENQKTKNWFLYQFFDEETKSPTVEWRINRQVVLEYGPLLRGTLYVAFHGSTELHPGSIRLLLRPQVRYYEKNHLLFIAPTKKFEKEDDQIFLDIRPKEI